MDISKSDGGGCVQCHIKIQNIAWDDIAAKPQLKKAKPTEIWNQLQEREACLQNNVSFVNKTVTPPDEHAAARERSAVTYRIPKAKHNFITESLLMKLCLFTRMIESVPNHQLRRGSIRWGFVNRFFALSFIY